MPVYNDAQFRYNGKEEILIEVWEGVPTDVQHESHSPLPMDIPLRVQHLIAHWHGAGRGEPLAALHSQCLDAAGRESKLLPARLLFVADLDVTHLRTALKRSNGLHRMVLA